MTKTVLAVSWAIKVVWYSETMATPIKEWLSDVQEDQRSLHEITMTRETCTVHLQSSALIEKRIETHRVGIHDRARGRAGREWSSLAGLVSSGPLCTCAIMRVEVDTEAWTYIVRRNPKYSLHLGV